MEVKVSFNNLSGLIKAYQKAPETTRRNLVLGLKKAMRDIQERAHEKHRFISRSGNLERAISYRVISENPIKGEVFLDQGIAKYGPFIHQGTRAHEIKAKNKKALRWSVSRGLAFSQSVKHPGIKADPFLYQSLKFNQRNIEEIFNRSVNKAIKEAGL